jgi:hypothetical protein
MWPQAQLTRWDSDSISGKWDLFSQEYVEVEISLFLFINHSLTESKAAFIQYFTIIPPGHLADHQVHRCPSAIWEIILCFFSVSRLFGLVFGGRRFELRASHWQSRHSNA